MEPYPRMRDRCDYDLLRKQFSKMFRNARPCVISVDLDGVLSAVLLAGLFDWEVVGFYTLDDLFLRREVLDPSETNPEAGLRKAELVFLDHDIYRPWIDSIGHHLLQWSPQTPIPLHTGALASLNPNLLRGITMKEFQRKYPFGTFHFLLACTNAWGVLGGFEPDDIVTALLLQIDSSFINAMTYQENALDWLDWLGGSDETSPLNPVCRRLSQFTPREILEQFRRLAVQFEEFGIPPRSQASVKDPTDGAQMRRLCKI